MTTNGPDVDSEGRVPQNPPEPVSAAAASRGIAGGLGWTRTLLVTCGVVAGLAAFGIGEATSELIPAETTRYNFHGAERVVITRDSPRVVTRTAALAFGVLGLCLGGGLGIAGGLAQRSVRACVAGGLMGAVLGGIVGAGVTLALLPFSAQMRSQYPSNDLGIGLVAHAVLLGLLGAVAGLAFAIGAGKPRLLGLAIAAGFVGGIVGSGAFDLIGAFAFPLAKTDSPISQTWATRFLARLFVCVGTAAVVALLLPAPPPAPAATQPEPSSPIPIPEA